MMSHTAEGVKTLGRNARVTIYLGVFIMFSGFFLFYGGHLLGFPIPPHLFLVSALIGFTLTILGKLITSSSSSERILLAIFLTLFHVSTLSLLASPVFRFGRWDFFLFMTLLFLAFITGGFIPTKKIRRKDYGIVGALIVSFFFEMYGLPLSLFILNTLLGLNFPLWGREGLEAAHLLVTLGLMDSTMAHFLSALTIGIGLTLLLIGHKTLYSAGDKIVTWGIYRYLKHPQYIGIIIMTGGMLIEYPTILSLTMWVLLIVMYTMKARRESIEIKQVKTR